MTGYRVSPGPALLLAVSLLSLAAELWLAERNVPLFGTDFRRFRTLDTPVEAAAFLAALVAAHLWLVLLLYHLLLWPRGRNPSAARAYFDFLFATTAGFGAVLFAKTKLFSYFSEALSLQLIRSLGGGSLTQALLYAGDEALPVLVALALAVIAYVVARRLLRSAVGADGSEGAWRPRRRWLAAGLAGTAPLLFAASGVGDTRPALDRFVAPYLIYAGLDAGTDFDLDGYSLFSRPRDRQPFDGRRHPYALDVPDNGIDEDGLAGDFRYGGETHLLSTPRFPGRRRHVVLIVLESTRADALTKRWQGIRIAPNMASLAERGTWSPEAYSHVGFTQNSLKTLFTGKLEPTSNRQSLFRDFKRNGYRVGVLSAQAEDFGGIAAAAAMRENSDVFIDAKVLEKDRIWTDLQNVSLIVDGKVLLREMDRHFGAKADWRQPTFLYFNFQAAHFPYGFPGALQTLPGQPIPRSLIRQGNRQWIQRTYWNAVAYGDWLVGRIAGRLQALGVLEDTVLVILGDHGEELFENGYLGHGQRLNALQTQIPLIFSTPGVAIPRPVGLDDLRVLILNAAGASAPPPGTEPVFQYIGDLDRPATIAMVERGGRWTTLDMEAEEVIWNGRSVEVPYAEIDGDLRGRVERLVYLWERERWLRHSGRRDAQRRSLPAEAASEAKVRDLKFQE